ncbi:ATP-binding cassette subfamily C protein LapB [Sinobacterium caligoides]|uniref:ATP-binding cassette subfamily C protein LapB n=1 Tax=Sinobacterium caligoides TaxID=933926 RepID=A0A3N2DMC1_9GAMM|nr:type I secretion system permease/ATPase [Sinobacterium caligoides]ROS00956.1 ATP-binding cassette subfamily C protein LapB [Sinobacterium caligoides]
MNDALENSHNSDNSWRVPPQLGGEDYLLDGILALCKLYGLSASAQRLTEGLPLVDGRLNLELTARAAKRAGLGMRLMKRQLAAIDHRTLPTMLLMRDGTTAILTAIDDKGPTVLDPVTQGRIEIDLETLTEQYSGYFFATRTLFEYKSHADSVAKQQHQHWFWSTIASSWRIYRDVIIATILINFFVLASPLFVMNVYDRVVPNNAIDTLWTFAIGATIIFSFDFLLKLLRTYCIDIAGKKADVLLSARIFEQVQSIKLSHGPQSTGSFAKNLADFESVRDFVTSATITTLIDLPFALMFLIIIGLLSGSLVWVPIAAIAMILLYSAIITPTLQQSIQKTYGASAEKNGLLIETLSNLENIKLQQLSSHHQQRWEQASGDIAHWSMRSRFLGQSASTVVSFITQMCTVVIVLCGVYFISDGDLSMGGLIAAVMLAGRAISPMGQISGLITRYQQAKTSYKGLSDIMAMPRESSDDAAYVSHPSLSGQIELKQVFFNFPNQPQPFLHDLNISFAAGSKTAVIGQIGSGKSTLMRLLTGLYEASAGSIMLDELSIDQISPSDLRSGMGCMTQQSELFSGSIRDNIVAGHRHVDDEEILRVAALAGVTRFTAEGASGLERPVGERGALLSGGQRQCVNLARALLNDPNILILDEPTAGLDNHSTAALINNLEQAAVNKTLILFTHNMSLLRLVDNIIVLDRGRVAISGPKHQVLKQLKGEADNV